MRCTSPPITPFLSSGDIPATSERSRRRFLWPAVDCTTLENTSCRINCAKALGLALEVTFIIADFHQCHAIQNRSKSKIKTVQ